MKYSIKKLIYISLFTIISCSNVSNFCKHGLSSGKQQFGYKLSFKEIKKSDIYFLDNEIIPVVYSTAQPLTWVDLAPVTFASKFNKQYQQNFQYPVFSNTVKELEGKEFYISGHVIPLDVNQGLYAVSKNPYSSCYFCGKSGPESVVSLKFKNKPSKYKLDKVKTFKGTLKLNDSNPMDFIYIFTNTEEFKADKIE